LASVKTEQKISYWMCQKYDDAVSAGVDAPAGRIDRDDWPAAFRIPYSSTSLDIKDDEVVSPERAIKLCRELMKLGISPALLLKLLKRGINVDDRAFAVKPIEVACGIIPISQEESYKNGMAKLTMLYKQDPEEFARIMELNAEGDTTAFHTEIYALGSSVDPTIELSDICLQIVGTVKADNARLKAIAKAKADAKRKD
jgi:hypothetical protein